MLVVLLTSSSCSLSFLLKVKPTPSFPAGVFHHAVQRPRLHVHRGTWPFVCPDRCWPLFFHSVRGKVEARYGTSDHASSFALMQSTWMRTWIGVVQNRALEIEVPINQIKPPLCLLLQTGAAIPNQHETNAPWIFNRKWLLFVRRLLHFCIVTEQPAVK